MEDLIHYLTHTSPGAIQAVYRLEQVLRKCWGQLAGSGDRKMAAYKLLGRMEQVRWRPPLLSFAVERHEAPGSTNAQVEHWAVNLDYNTAAVITTEQRTLYPLSPAATPAIAAIDIAQLIISGCRDQRLHWEEPDTVCVLASWSCPRDSPVSGMLGVRRKQLRHCIGEVLTPHGWRHVGGSWFKRTKTDCV
jgi:hypothetical protein